MKPLKMLRTGWTMKQTVFATIALVIHVSVGPQPVILAEAVSTLNVPAVSNRLADVYHTNHANQRNETRNKGRLGSAHQKILDTIGNKGKQP